MEPDLIGLKILKFIIKLTLFSFHNVLPMVHTQLHLCMQHLVDVMEHEQEQTAIGQLIISKNHNLKH